MPAEDITRIYPPLNTSQLNQNILLLFATGFVFGGLFFPPASVRAAEGELTFRVVDETTGAPIAARVELTRPELVLPGATTRKRVSRRDSLRVVRPLPARGTIETAFGFIVDGEVRLILKEGPYEFRVTHGPGYRVIHGNFAIEKTSEDEHTVALPRILDMRKNGWTSGDAYVPPSPRAGSPEMLDQRMRSEDLFVVATEPSSDSQSPMMRTIAGSGLAFYDREIAPIDGDDELSVLTRLAGIEETTRVAIENPFAWPVPVFLASDRIDGFFVLGDWLRLDKTLTQPDEGRATSQSSPRDPISLGREAEQIYWETLDAGFRLAPMAGTGDAAIDHPVGYNRLYVADPPNEYASHRTDDLADEAAIESDKPVSETEWWDGAWKGRSFATNGPLLQPRLDGKFPGHVFEIADGESMSLTPEVTITVRDPVEYLEVIQNGFVHYTSKLDEFAKAGGRISPIQVNQSGWALIRVVTLHEGHFRAAMSAPWYFEVGGKRRISKRSVAFFREWLADYESHLTATSPQKLADYAPFIRSARGFWQIRLEQANSR